MRHLLLLLLFTAPVLAQISPPDKARLVGSDPVVTFRWPGKANQSYFLQILAGTAEAYAESVKGNSIQLRLRPGPLYRWKASQIVGGGYRTVAEGQFQLSSDLVFDFNGRRGRDGLEAPRSGSYSLPHEGGRGEAGGNAPNLRIELVPGEEYTAVTITGAPAIRRFLLLPGSQPLQIFAQGGDGGSGGAGSQGYPGYFEFYNGYVTYTGVPGGNGGPGGPGGNGGNVVIDGPPDLVEVHNEGGRGGEGGLAGASSRPYNTPPYGYSYPQIADGRPGPAAPDGRDGVVTRR
ncbi:MAG: hypothetical protein AB7S38_17470 [Vulcanimicrobiota bacterium]